MSKTLNELMPEMIENFGKAGDALGEASDLDEKTRELITLAYGIAHQCDDCIGGHTKILADMGASENEIATVVAIGVMMGGGPGMAYGQKALDMYYKTKGQ